MKKPAIGKLPTNHLKMKQTKIIDTKQCYFYPLISQFPSYRGLSSAKPENLPIATKVAEQVICLPIYPDLQISSTHYICSLLSNI